MAFQEGFQIRLGDGPQLDAFGRLRVSNPETLFDSLLEYGPNDLFWETKVENGGGIERDANSSTLMLRTSTANGSRVVRQSRQYMRYQPLKSHLIALTGNFLGGQADVTKQLGLFDDYNGVFFRCNGVNNALVLRSFVSGKVVDNIVQQGDWNIATLTGGGMQTDLVYDNSKSQIFFIDLEYLAVGRVRCGFFLGGTPLYVHEFVHANKIESAYMQTANLPVRYEIVNTDDIPSSGEMRQICAAVVSEGGANERSGAPHSVHSGLAGRSINGRVPIISIRPKQLYKGKTNRAQLIIENIDVSATEEKTLVEIIYGGALTGDSFVSVDDESIAEYDNSAAAVTGGLVLYSFVVPANSQGNKESPAARSTGFLSRVPIALDIDGNHPVSPYTDCFSIVCTTGGASVTNASINWRELK